MNFKLLAVALLTTVGLAACSGEKTEESSAAKENEVQDVKELVNDYSVRNLKAESASITSHDLTVKESDGSEQVYDLPEDEFFVSIAPYVNQTHP